MIELKTERLWWLQGSWELTKLSSNHEWILRQYERIHWELPTGRNISSWTKPVLLCYPPYFHLIFECSIVFSSLFSVQKWVKSPELDQLVTEVLSLSHRWIRCSCVLLEIQGVQLERNGSHSEERWFRRSWKQNIHQESWRKACYSVSLSYDLISNLE